VDQGCMQCGDLRFDQLGKLAERNEGICDGGHTRKKKYVADSALIGTMPLELAASNSFEVIFVIKPARVLKRRRDQINCTNDSSRDRSATVIWPPSM
jgi:hypothetical protein